MNVEKKLEALKTYVKNRSYEDAESIIKDAQKKAKDISKEYAQKAEDEYLRITQEAKKESDYMQRQEMAQAESKKFKLIMEGQKEIADDALELLKKKLLEIPQSKSYDSFLRFSTSEAIKALNSTKIILKVRKADKTLMINIIDTLKKELKCDIALSDDDAMISGGVIAESANGKEIVENTIESKFEELREEYLRELFAKLKVR